MARRMNRRSLEKPGVVRGVFKGDSRPSIAIGGNQSWVSFFGNQLINLLQVAVIDPNFKIGFRI